MRKIILFMVMSLDGYIGGSNGDLSWEIQDPEIGRYLIADLLTTVDSLILGRVLYQGFAGYWPRAAQDPKNPKELTDFANWIEVSPKFVVSKTLDTVEWKNSTLLKVQNDDDIGREVTKLKEGPGKDIVLFGGARIAQTLVRLGLVDEYRFKIQPIALGSGLPLFKDLKEKIQLKLISEKTFKAGVVTIYYQPLSSRRD